MILKFCIFTQLELNYRYITSHDFEILISFVVELFIYLFKKKKKKKRLGPFDFIKVVL